jgi:thiopurine S-methyltransferase
MDLGFWRQLWEEQDSPLFDQKFPNALLIDSYPSWAPYSGTRVFVPLCGKSVDMRWLEEQGHSVLGIEVSENAVRKYFSCEPTESRHTSQGKVLKSFAAQHTEIFVGDYFCLTLESTRDCQACYDRASLVAFPPEMRRKYALQLGKLLVRGCRTLLITFEFQAPSEMGPPFSVPGAEIRDLFSNDFHIQEIQQKEIIPKNPKFRDAGIPLVKEVATLMVRT